jgi:hypothetical protein
MSPWGNVVDQGCVTPRKHCWPRLRHPEETLLTKAASPRGNIVDRGPTMFPRGGISEYHLTWTGGHRFLYRIESPAGRASNTPISKHDFRSWFGQMTTQMNRAPFSTHHDVTWLWRNRTVWRSAYGWRYDVGISQCIAIVAFNCIGSLSEARPGEATWQAWKNNMKLFWCLNHAWIGGYL